MNLRSLLPLLCAALLLPAAARAATLFVPSQYPTIQAGVNAAVSGDTVLVADGTYRGPGNRDVDFNGKNITVTSQHGAASTIIDCGGFASTDGSGNHRGFYIHRGETAATISGLTVRNGSESTVSGSSLTGGGICVQSSNVVIQNCTVANNTVPDNGGGISVLNGVVALQNCIIARNTAGSGATNSGSGGGGVYNNGILTLIDCAITRNQADYGGVDNDGTLTLTGCVISDNMAYDTGGGIFSGGMLTLTGCTISGNTTTGGSRGGGIYNYGSVSLANCLLTSNTAQDGAGFYNVSSESVALINCTIAGNRGSGIYNVTPAASPSGSTLTLTNSIVYENTGGGIGNGSQNTSVATATYSDLQGGFPGTGNIDADPLFANAAGGDFHLNLGSPCLSAGTHTGAPITDKDGRARPTPPSIGVYELDTILDVPSRYATIQAAINAAVNGDTVLVADGTYSGPGNRDIDFLGKNITVASQHGAASSTIDCGGTASSDGSGNHRGFYIHRGEQQAVVKGFTIKNGYEFYQNNIASSNIGAGIYIEESSASIQQCIITANKSDGVGGGTGIYNYYGHTITLVECTFSGNNSDVGGGLIIISNGGTTLVLGCTITDNTASFGGGIQTNNSDGSGTVLLSNCTIAQNTAQEKGGGVYNYNLPFDNSALGIGTITFSSCTITRNIAQVGGGVYNYYVDGSSNTISFVNSILYSDTSGELENSPQTGADATATYSDVQGGYPGTGNIDADPQFVNAAFGNFHLKSGSPCLGAGTSSGAPATDKDGRTRPSPPSIGAYELVPASAAHILWDNPNGTASVWTVDSTGGYTFHNYGPYPGWVATALADTRDGKTHLLWDHTADHQISVWDVDAQNSVTFHNYGPFAGWTAAGMSAGPDGRLHLLWNHRPDNQMSLWSLDNGAGTYSHREYGPFAGWSAKLLATGGDGATDVVWTKTDGQVSSWKVSAADGSYLHHEYGPYPGWSANALAAGPVGRASLAWGNTDGTQSLWNADFGAGTYSFTNYGPYPGWAVTNAAVGSDGVRRLLWNHAPDGMASLWTVDGAGGFAARNYGPFVGWSAVSLSAGQ